MAFRITLSSEYGQWREFLLAVPARMDTDGTWIYGGKRNLIKSFEAPDGTVLVVKRYHRPRGVNALVYSLGIRSPKGERAFQYASVLHSHGVDTPGAGGIYGAPQRRIAARQLSRYAAL